jgi:hypothetical protein
MRQRGREDSFSNEPQDHPIGGTISSHLCNRETRDSPKGEINMKRSFNRALAVLSAIGFGLSTGVTAANAAGDPPDPFAEVCNHKSGCVSGVVTWSNRSAAVSVNLFDDKNDGSTTVVAEFYTGDNVFIWDTDTRTANNERIKRTLSSEGPVGGIWLVNIYLVANVDGTKTFVTQAFRRD